MTNVALIVAAGKGERAGGDLPKQFAELGGSTVIAHSVAAFRRHPRIDAIHVVIAGGQEAMLARALGGHDVDGVIIGGAERHDSVRLGLEAVAATGQVQNVLIHDAARPLLSAQVIDRLLDAMELHKGAVPILPVVDTLAENGGETGIGAVTDRARLLRVQTPQAFHFDAIFAAHQNWPGGNATDDAQMLRAFGEIVAAVEGDVMLDKITMPADFASAEARLQATMISRTGFGYDVHRLERGKELWLAGVKIAHDFGLSGHSDADVALHAVTDALLGAIGDGDIGSHFPPSDAKWKGAASHLFVEHARDLIRARGGIIDHVDLTIICEAPKIGPYREAMREALADMLQRPPEAISIKATTTERLGFTGRGEGIAAQAIATVRL